MSGDTYHTTGPDLSFSSTTSVKYMSKSRSYSTTNLEFSRWVNVLYDEQMTAALVGRLTHHCHLLLFPGEKQPAKGIKHQ